MKKFLAAAMFAALFTLSANAEKNSDPAGTTVYSLPSTTLAFTVEALQENFHAGPYARYAQKYLGIDARQEDEVTYTISSVKMNPRIEADLTTRYSVVSGGKNFDASFLKLTRLGLVSVGGSEIRTDEWRFTQNTSSDFASRGVGSNLTSEQTTLFRNGKVAVQQNEVVEKTPEKKAEEAAQMIFKLRKTRVQILTGDTDANYSGAAMGTAIEEIARLEKEYVSLFTGYSDFQTQTMTFEVKPEADNANGQKYIAFRVSDSAGLVPEDNISGRPILLQITPEPVTEVTEADSKAKGPFAYYRIPAVCQVKLMDGTDIILQTRTTIYQLGTTSSFPLNLNVK